MKLIKIKKPVLKKKKKEVKKNSVSDAIDSKLTEIKKATDESSSEIPKGNILEQQMVSDETKEMPPLKEKEEAIKEDEKIERRGRPKGSRNKSTKQAQEEQEPGGKKIDQIMIYEEVGLMALCKRFNKSFSDIQLSQEEKDLLLSLQPETEFLNKPSWPNYIATNLALILIKWFNAPEIKEQVKEQVKENSFVSRSNSASENDLIIQEIDKENIIQEDL